MILGCPLAGVAKDEVLDATPALRGGTRALHRRPGVLQPAAQVQVSISGCAQHCSNHEINDVSFVGVTGPDGTARLRPLGRRRAVHQPEVRPAAGAFVEPDRVAEVWAGVTALFREHGYRRSRQHARLKFLLADWGTERFREVLEKDFLDTPLPDGPAPERYEGARGHAG